MIPLFYVLSLLAGLSVGAPLGSPPRVVRPAVSGAPEVVGLVSDAALNRDSCASSLFNNRVLWTCRDTQPMQSNGLPAESVSSSSASWTNRNPNGSPALSQDNVVTAYGSNNQTPFYPLLADECNNNSAGACDDGTRYAIWPDSPPLVTSVDSSSGAVTAYTWIKKEHIDDNLDSLTPYPATTLYRVNYSPPSNSNTSTSTRSLAALAALDALPSVSVVDEAFWPAGGITYGDYGNVVGPDGWAYLYAQIPKTDGVALARAPATAVEDASQYQYYVNGAWTSAMPGTTDTGVAVPNASAGGQGTYYYSEPWKSYVWIGQAGMSVAAQFYITTAPAPEGPWIEPFLFHEAESGTAPLGAYSLAANPALVPAANAATEMYLTYTKNDVVSEGSDETVFSTPLIRIQWE